MIYLYDRATIGGALSLPLEPRLRALLADRIGSLDTPFGDLAEWTEYLIVENGDREADIEREVRFSPLTEPIKGVRYREPGFYPHWDWLKRHDGWFELIESFGSTFAYVLFIEDHPDSDPELLALCREYAE